MIQNRANRETVKALRDAGKISSTVARKWFWSFDMIDAQAAEIARLKGVMVEVSKELETNHDHELVRCYEAADKLREAAKEN